MTSYLDKYSFFRFFFLGILLTLISCNTSSQNYTEVNGTITKIKKKDFLKKTAGYITVEYINKEGKKQTGKLNAKEITFPKLNTIVTIKYNNQEPYNLILVPESVKQKRTVTYILLFFTSLMILGVVFSYRYAMKNNSSFIFKPIFLIIIIILFFVSLYATITGQTYDQIVPFIK